MKNIPQVRKNIENMSGYVPGEQPKGLSRIIKLNTNENPYPPSPEAKKTLETFDWQRLNRYPDPVGQALREEIAAYHGVTPDMIICANGSDDILTIVSRCFIDPDHALACPDPTYSLYVSLAALQDAPCIRIPLLEGFDLPEDFEEQAKGASIIMLARPNAPTGNLYPKERMERLCETFDGAVFIDEAYADFSADNCAEFVKKYPNVIISRTFSKSRSLAGLRFGYAIAQPELIAQLMKAKDSYNISMLTQAVALAVFRDQAYLAKTVQAVKDSREALVKGLQEAGFKTVPSETNFVFAMPPDGDGERFFKFLRTKNIIVRYFPGAVTGKYVRITVGLPEEMDALFEAVKEYLA